jgi:hypothetical protein
MALGVTNEGIAVLAKFMNEKVGLRAFAQFGVIWLALIALKRIT